MKIRKFVKTFLLTLICVLTCGALLPNIEVNAKKNETTKITYYAVYDYVAHENLMDATESNITDGQRHNVDGLVFSANFGYHGGSNKIDMSTSQILGGGKVFTSGDKDITFSEWQGNGNLGEGYNGGLKVNEVKLTMYAVNKDGTYASYKIYKNGWYSNVEERYLCSANNNDDNVHECDDSDLIGTYTPTADNPTITLTGEELNNGGDYLTTDGILIRFDTDRSSTGGAGMSSAEGNIARIYYTSFQITKYESWDLVRWSTKEDYSSKSSTEKLVEIISKTATYTTSVGEFSPMFSKLESDDTSAKWVTAATTSFNASVEGLFDYPDTPMSGYNKTDVGRDYGNTRNKSTGSSPSEISPSGYGYAYITESVNLINATWKLDTSDGDYVWTANGYYYQNGKKYRKKAVMTARYWDGTYNGAGADWQSNNSGWCSHVNAGVTPCYKHSGYSSHGTVWDLSVYIYKCLSGDETVIANSVYSYSTYNDLAGKSTKKYKTNVNDGVVTLKTANGTNQSNPVNGDNIASVLSTTNEGVYRFYVTLTDMLGQQATLQSYLFYIDTTAPTITFENTYDKWYTDEESFPVVKATVTDTLSGLNKIKGKVEYSKDGVTWFSDGEIQTLYNHGNTDKTVEYNPEETMEVGIRLTKHNGYMYYRVKVMSEDIAGNQSELYSQVYKYDASPNANYTLSIPRLRTDTSYCEGNEICLNWTNQDVTAYTTFVDNESGISEAELLKGTAYSDEFYQIKYDLDGGTMNDPIYYYSSSMSVTLPTPTKDGYAFIGWTGSNGETPQKEVEISEGSTGLKTYKANWVVGVETEETVQPGNIKLNNSRYQLITYDNEVIKVLGEWHNESYLDSGLLVAADKLVKGENYVQTTRITQDAGLYIATKDKNGNVSYTPYIVDHIDKDAPIITFDTVNTDTWHTTKNEMDTIVVTINDELSGVKTSSITRQRCKATSVAECVWEDVKTEDTSDAILWKDGGTFKTGENYSRDIQELETLEADVTTDVETGYMFYRIYVTTTDFAGNSSEAYSPIQKYDAIPEISYTLSPGECEGTDDGKCQSKSDNPDGMIWTNGDVTVKIEASDDESGVQIVCFASKEKLNSVDECDEILINNGKGNLGENKTDSKEYVEDERTISTDNKYLVVFDKNDNQNSTPYLVRHIDKIDPSINFTPTEKSEKNPDPVNVEIKVNDTPDNKDGAKSEVKTWTVCHSVDAGKSYPDGECKTYTGDTLKITEKVEETGYHKFKVTVEDNAGNKTTGESGIYIILGNAPTIVAKTDYWWVDDDADIYDELKENATAISELDGDLSDSIIVTRITYADGEIVDYPTEDDKIKTTIAQNFVAEFEVTDSNGTTAYASQTYQVLDRSLKPVQRSENSNYYVYQRYIDERKAALDVNSEWQTSSGYKQVLDSAINDDSGTVTKTKTVTRSK